MESLKYYTRSTVEYISRSAGRLLAAPLKINILRGTLKESVKGSIRFTRIMGSAFEAPRKELEQIIREAQEEAESTTSDIKRHKIPIRESESDKKLLNEQSIEELYELAQDYDISGRSEMNKQQLIQAIRKKRGKSD